MLRTGTGTFNNIVTPFVSLLLIYGWFVDSVVHFGVTSPHTEVCVPVYLLLNSYS